MSSIALTQAVTSGDAGAVNALLADGANVNERTSGGQTPLILATIFGHTHLIPLLLNAGADPQLRDNLGLNALDWAQRRGATEAIELFRGKKATVRTTAQGEVAARRQSATPQSRHEGETSKPVSDEEKSQRWLAGLKQRIAEQSQRDVPDGPNIFRKQPPPPSAPLSQSETQSSLQHEPHSQSLPEPPLPSGPAQREPQLTPAQWQRAQPQSQREPRQPQRETPQPQREMPPPPEPELPPKPEPLPASQPEPIVPEPEPLPTPEPEVEPIARLESAVNEKVSAPRSRRKRCPKCGAIYNSDLVAYCAHHFVALIDADEPPIISEPPKSSPVLFWMIIVITLTGSLVIGSLIATFFYNANRAGPAAGTSKPGANAVQKGTPAVGQELEGKVMSLPIAECPLNGQEAIPGTVLVHVVINKGGQVTSARASGGDWLLRGAASEAAMKSTFSPEKLRGRETEGTITYTFEP